MGSLLKSFSPLIVFVFLFMGSGCGGGAGTTNTTQNPTSQATPNSTPTITLRATLPDASFISSSLNCRYTLLDFTGNPLTNDSAMVTPTETEFVVAKISGVDPSSVALTTIFCDPASSSSTTQRNFLVETTKVAAEQKTLVGVTLDTTSTTPLVESCTILDICSIAQMVIDRCNDPGAPLVCGGLFVIADFLTTAFTNECAFTEPIAQFIESSSFFSCQSNSCLLNCDKCTSSGGTCDLTNCVCNGAAPPPTACGAEIQSCQQGVTPCPAPPPGTNSVYVCTGGCCILSQNTCGTAGQQCDGSTTYTSCILTDQSTGECLNDCQCHTCEISCAGGGVCPASPTPGLTYACQQGCCIPQSTGGGG